MDYFFHLLSTQDFLIFAYLIIGTFAFTESLAFVGLAVPGGVIVIIGGFLAAQGILNIGYLFIFAVLGAVLGDYFSYYLGKQGIISFDEKNRIFKPVFLKKGEDYFKKYGSKSVFFGRIVGWARPVVPFVAGVFGLNKKSFLIWNIFSVLSWAVLHIGLGYFFGQAWQTIVLWSGRASILAAILAGFLIVFYLSKWLVLKKGKQILAITVSSRASIKEAIINNDYIKKFVSGHERFFNFIKARLDKNKFFGLPFSLLTLAFIYVLSLLVGIIQDVVSSDVIVGADVRIANLLAVFRSPELTKFFFWVTLLGKWQVVFVFLLAAILWLWLSKKYVYAFFLFSTVFGSEFLTWLGKHIFHRARPEVAVYTEHSYSFPSGHATIAMAFYGFLAFALIREAKQWKAKVNYFFAGAIIILFIGFSRLYLGVHYLSDVLGGYLIGFLGLLIGISIIEWINSWKKEKTEYRPPKKHRIILALAALASLVFYVNFAVHYNPIPAPEESNLENHIVADASEIFINEQIKFTR